MAKPIQLKRTMFALVIVVGVLVALTLVDWIPNSTARPPENLKTIKDFQAWKKVVIKGKGTFGNAGTTYTVVFAPAGYYLASGPSAYLFDANGEFVDWTPDMGDVYTVKNHFDLTSGHVKNIEHQKP